MSARSAASKLRPLVQMLNAARELEEVLAEAQQAESRKSVLAGEISKLEADEKKAKDNAEKAKLQEEAAVKRYNDKLKSLEAEWKEKSDKVKKDYEAEQATLRTTTAEAKAVCDAQIAEAEQTLANLKSAADDEQKKLDTIRRDYERIKRKFES